jgi:hypothetical protein
MIAPQEEAQQAVAVCKIAAWSFWERGMLSTYLEAGFSLEQAQLRMTMDDWTPLQELPN